MQVAAIFAIIRVAPPRGQICNSIVWSRYYALGNVEVVLYSGKFCKNTVKGVGVVKRGLAAICNTAELPFEPGSVRPLPRKASKLSKADGGFLAQEISSTTSGAECHTLLCRLWMYVGVLSQA